MKSIVAKALFIWEQLAVGGPMLDTSPSLELEIRRRLDRWCRVVADGDWEILGKRLAWAELDFGAVRRSLAPVAPPSDLVLPHWAEILQEIVEAANSFCRAALTTWPIDPRDPIPFEDILLPILQVARQRLATRLRPSRLPRHGPPSPLLTAEAHTSLERGLLCRISELCAKTLIHEFSLGLPPNYQLLNLLGVNDGGGGRSHYNRFVARLFQPGAFMRFFETYPVLARLMATAVEFWVEFTAEWMDRLIEDWSSIQAVFGQDVGGAGKVINVQSSLSDPHNSGRTVVLLSFEHGLKLLYKPRGLGVEVAFNRFIDWCNRRGQHTEFKVVQCLARQSYGWTEHIEQRACSDETAAELFYRRAGMLLCVLHTLRGVDGHNENLIASGEYPVLIDMEAMMHPEPHLMDPSLEVSWREGRDLRESVLRTGLLPPLDERGQPSHGFGISGFGCPNLQDHPQRAMRWRYVNCDDMHLSEVHETPPIEKNVPRIGQVALSAEDFRSAIAEGFRQMYRFLAAHKEELLDQGGPLAAMQHQDVRFIFRATRVYRVVLDNALRPDFLKEGVDFSIELDRLSRAFLAVDERPTAWPILAAELRAMEQLDVPAFKANTASDKLDLADNGSIPHYFKQPSYQEVRALVASLNESDLAQQIKVIDLCFPTRRPTKPRPLRTVVSPLQDRGDP